VLTARSLPITILSILGFAALAAPADPAAASTQPAVRSATSHVRASVAGQRGAGCAKRSAHATRRARLAARLCRARSQEPSVQDTAKTRPARTRPAGTRPATTRAAKSHSAKSRPAAIPRAKSPTPAPSTAPVAGPSAAQSDAAIIAAILATPCQNTELTPEADNIAVVREAVLCLINRKRAEDGENPLKSSPELEQAAEGHCSELIAEDYFAHISPSGETPVDRIRDTGYIPNASVGYVIGENLAWGTYQLSTPQSIVSAWIASPGHLANILESQYVETGIGVTPAVPVSLAAGAPGATYAQEFGVIVS
jgi:uncharacterized protein YkwD